MIRSVWKNDSCYRRFFGQVLGITVIAVSFGKMNTINHRKIIIRNRSTMNISYQDHRFDYRSPNCHSDMLMHEMLHRGFLILYVSQVDLKIYHHQNWSNLQECHQIVSKIGPFSRLKAIQYLRKNQNP